jgi:hypothetical protein
MCFLLYSFLTLHNKGIRKVKPYVRQNNGFSKDVLVLILGSSGRGILQM